MVLDKFSLRDRVAVVTGGGQGLGKVFCHAFAEAGADVVVAEINEDTGPAVADEIELKGRRALYHRTDVTVRSSLEEMHHAALAQFGRIDILMNNAGIGSGHTWDDTIGINLSGVFYGLKHACRILAEGGGGAIVNTSSIAGLNGLMRPTDYHDNPPELEGINAYVAAKHGVVGLTRQFAIAFGKSGVRVNAVCPGYIVTPMTAPAREAEGGTPFLEALHPIGRLGEPSEVAAVAAFLASADASFVTGAAIPVDGGYSAR